VKTQRGEKKGKEREAIQRKPGHATLLFAKGGEKKTPKEEEKKKRGGKEKGNRWRHRQMKGVEQGREKGKKFGKKKEEKRGGSCPLRDFPFAVGRGREGKGKVGHGWGQGMERQMMEKKDNRRGEVGCEEWMKDSK